MQHKEVEGKNGKANKSLADKFALAAASVLDAGK